MGPARQRRERWGRRREGLEERDVGNGGVRESDMGVCTHGVWILEAGLGSSTCTDAVPWLDWTPGVFYLEVEKNLKEVHN